MAIYEYDCAQCGRFETQQPMGAVAAARDCPECHQPARRVFSAPHLTGMSGPLRRAHALAERSADEPEVVTTVPGRQSAARPNPALARLPRP